MQHNFSVTADALVEVSHNANLQWYFYPELLEGLQGILTVDDFVRIWNRAVDNLYPETIKDFEYLRQVMKSREIVELYLEQLVKDNKKFVKEALKLISPLDNSSMQV